MQSVGIVQYHGMVQDIRTILENTHCTVLPSYHEGMSNVLLESAACGRPVITTNVSGCREAVEDGLTGFLVEKQSAKNLIEKIEKFLALSHEQKRQMGLAGREKIEQQFDRRKVVDSYCEEINCLWFEGGQNARQES